MTYDPGTVMGHILAVALSFPAVVYTVLLGVSLVYWVFVMASVANVNLFGEGAGDAALDGVAKGALEGAAKGMAEGVADHFAADHVDGGAEPDGLDGDVGEGGLTGIVAALKLRAAPATVVLSIIMLFSWIFTMVGAQFVERLSAGVVVMISKIVLLVLAPAFALFPTSVVVRPLARVFAPPYAATREDLVGKLCTIRTGSVTDRFGEATLEDGGAGVVVRVRVDGGERLARGDCAVIVGYDADRQEFTVAPLDEVFEHERSRTRR